MKKCELCENRARTRCESDQAILCLACDAKVHSANFLVARHSRSLLCQKCQAPTSWRATGARLSPAVSVCDKCVRCCGGRQAPEVESRERSMGGGDEDEEEDGENQVVPLSSTPPSSLSGPAASRSINEESSFRVSVCSGAQSEAPVRVSMKRKREDEDTHHHHQEEKGRSSSQANNETADDEVTSSVHATVSKQRKKTVHDGEGTNKIVILSRLQKEAINSAERTAKEAGINESRTAVVQPVSTIAQRRVTKT